MFSSTTAMTFFRNVSSMEVDSDFPRLQGYPCLESLTQFLPELDQVFDPRLQFLRLERLDQVVVGPGFQPLQLALSSRPGRQQDDRDMARRSSSLRHGTVRSHLALASSHRSPPDQGLSQWLWLYLRRRHRLRGPISFGEMPLDVVAHVGVVSTTRTRGFSSLLGPGRGSEPSSTPPCSS